MNINSRGCGLQSQNADHGHPLNDKVIPFGCRAKYHLPPLLCVLFSKKSGHRNATSKCLISSLILSLALISSACGSPMKTPDIKQNPHPKIRYEITMTIQGAPGPFDSINGDVQYGVANDHCVPLQPLSGARLSPDKHVPLVFTRVSGNLYKGTVYADLLQDEDYFGRGTCHWTVVGATAVLKVKTTDFSPAVFHDDIVAQKPVATYFANGDYLAATKNSGDERVIAGSPNRALYGSESRTDLFSITLTAKEDFQ
ncbi:MAG: hypothetical protein V4566_08575 [Pseudomonadota bacterium]|jgi:hypothetical protein